MSVGRIAADCKAPETENESDNEDSDFATEQVEMLPNLSALGLRKDEMSDLPPDERETCPAPLPYHMRPSWEVALKPDDWISQFSDKQLLYEVARTNITNYTGDWDYMEWKKPIDAGTGLTAASDDFFDSMIFGTYTYKRHAKACASDRLIRLRALLSEFEPESTSERFSFHGTEDGERVSIRLVDTRTITAHERTLLSPFHLWLPEGAKESANPSDCAEEIVLVRQKVAAPDNSIPFTLSLLSSGILEHAKFWLQDIDLTCDFSGVIGMAELRNKLISTFGFSTTDADTCFTDADWDGSPTLLDTSARTGLDHCIQWMFGHSDMVIRAKLYHTLVRAIESGPVRSNMGNRLPHWQTSQGTRFSKSRDATTETGIVRLELTLHANRRVNAESKRVERVVPGSHLPVLLSHTPTQLSNLLHQTVVAQWVPPDVVFHCPHHLTIASWMRCICHVLVVYDVESNSGLVAYSYNQHSKRLSCYYVSKNWDRVCDYVYKYMGMGPRPMDVICINKKSRPSAPTSIPSGSNSNSDSDSESEPDNSRKRIYNAEYDYNPIVLHPSSELPRFGAIHSAACLSNPIPGPVEENEEEEGEQDDTADAVADAECKSLVHRHKFVKEGWCHVYMLRTFRRAVNGAELVTRFPYSTRRIGIDAPEQPHSADPFGRRLLLSSGFGTETPDGAIAPVNGALYELPLRTNAVRLSNVEVHCSEDHFHPLGVDLTTVRNAVTFDLFKAHKLYVESCHRKGISPMHKSKWISEMKRDYAQARFDHRAQRSTEWEEEWKTWETAVMQEQNLRDYKNWLRSQTGSASSFFSLPSGVYFIFSIVVQNAQFGCGKQTRVILFLRKEKGTDTYAVHAPSVAHRSITSACLARRILSTASHDIEYLVDMSNLSSSAELGVLEKRVGGFVGSRPSKTVLKRSGVNRLNFQIHLDRDCIYDSETVMSDMSSIASPASTMVDAVEEEEEEKEEKEEEKEATPSADECLPRTGISGVNPHKVADFHKQICSPTRHPQGLVVELVSVRKVENRPSLSSKSKPGIIFEARLHDPICIGNRSDGESELGSPDVVHLFWASPNMQSFFKEHSVIVDGRFHYPHAKRFLLVCVCKTDSRFSLAESKDDWIPPSSHSYLRDCTALERNPPKRIPKHIKVRSIKEVKTHDGRIRHAIMCSNGRLWRIGNYHHWNEKTCFSKMQPGWIIDTANFCAHGPKRVPAGLCCFSEEEEEEEEEEESAAAASPPTKKQRVSWEL